MNENSSWTNVNRSWISPTDIYSFNETSNVTEHTNGAKLLLEGCRYWIPNLLLPIVVTIGVVGNGVTVFVMTRKRMKSSTNTYLTALAVSDLLFLIFNMILSLHHINAFEPIRNEFYWHVHKWTYWLTDASSACSNWLTVSFTLERFIAVRYPLRGRILCTESRARRVIASVVTLALLLTITTAFEWEVQEYDGKASLKLTWLGAHSNYKSVFYWFSSITFMLIPLVSLSGLNFLLVATVRRSSKGRTQLTEDARGMTGSFRPNSKNSVYSRAGSERSPPMNRMSQRSKFKERQENKVTIVLISVVFLFLICQAPSGITVIVKIFYEPKDHTTGDYLLRSAGNILNFLMVINAASNFFLYCALSDTYQRTLAATFCRGRRQWIDRTDTLSTAASFRNSSTYQNRREQESLSQC